MTPEEGPITPDDRPTSPPKCLGCGRQWAAIATSGHVAGCEVGAAKEAEAAVIREVRAGLQRAVDDALQTVHEEYQRRDAKARKAMADMERLARSFQKRRG